MGIIISIEFDRESPGSFDSRTLNRKTLNRRTGRTHGGAGLRLHALEVVPRGDVPGFLGFSPSLFLHFP